MLAVNNIEVLYDRVILVLKGVSLTVPRGGIVALLGANGAGKTTTLKAISNLLHAERGEVAKGTILFDGVEVQALSPSELVRRGCIQVMEGRPCFAHLTTRRTPDGALRGVTARPRSAATSTLSTRIFRGCVSDARRSPAIRPAASSRCAPSAAP
jgi:ABC-type branched-subunit amino acid transport system ATPase component